MMLLPDWNSIESTTRWSDILFWAGIVCLILLAATEVASHIYSNRASYLIAERARTDSAKREQAEQDAQQRHADEMAKMQSQLSAAEQQVAKFEKQQAPRHLDDVQKQRLVNFLTGKPRTTVIIKANAAVQDARAYAEELAAAFRSAGWNMRIDNALITGVDTAGVYVTIRTPDAVPLGGAILYDAFADAGIPIRDNGKIDPSMPPSEDVWLIIGPKN